jgi:D-alanine-D-alanine ligase
MKIGIAFDLKPKTPLPQGAPDDLHEEFDSPVTVQSIAEILRGRGHEVRELGNGRELIEQLLREPPDLVFNFAEGSGVSRSRESRVPALCEMLNIPYTGSDPVTLGMALDKDICRRMVEDAEVAIPDGIMISFPTALYDGDFAEFPPMIEESGLKLPLIAKPTCEGSSKGIRNRCLIRTTEEFGPTIVGLWHDYKQPVLVEEFIDGEEVTVGVIGNDPPRILGSMQVVPKSSSEPFVYSLEVKRNWQQMVEYRVPQLTNAMMLAVEDAALRAYDILGCRDVTRIDFRIRDGVPYFLEANPLPGLNPESSDLVFLARLHGIEYRELIESILLEAIQRLGIKE